MTMSKDEEGFVVCDKYFNRIKILGLRYHKYQWILT